MKKIIGMVLAFAMAAGVFADSLRSLGSEFGKNLDAITGSKNEAAAGTLPENREILPILWKYAYDTPELVDKVVAFSANLADINPIDNTYTFVQKVTFKSFGLQEQEATVVVWQEGTKIFVETKKMLSYSVDKNGKPSSKKNEMMKKAMTQNSKNILGDFEKSAKELSDDDYQKWYNAAYFSIPVQTGVADHATNKLKAKKWFNAHPIEGKQTSGTMFVTSVDESKHEGYEYKVLGMVNVTQKNEIQVEFHTNNEAYVDIKATESVRISGNVVKVQYTGDYLNYYGVSSLVIEE